MDVRLCQISPRVSPRVQGQRINARRTVCTANPQPEGRALADAGDARVGHLTEVRPPTVLDVRGDVPNFWRRSASPVFGQSSRSTHTEHTQKKAVTWARPTADRKGADAAASRRRRWRSKRVSVWLTRETRGRGPKGLRQRPPSWREAGAVSKPRRGPARRPYRKKRQRQRRR